MNSRLLPLACLPAFAVFSFAQVTHIRDYTLHQPRDRNILFEMAVTPEQDLLVWRAMIDGKWRLTRLRNWLDKEPIEQTIELPGATLANASPLRPDFLVTPDGSFAITATSTIVSVIDLRAFRVLKTVANEPPSFYLDHGGRLVHRVSTWDRDTRESAVRLMVLIPPALSVSDQCHFTEKADFSPVVSPHVPAPPRIEGTQDCNAFLSRAPGAPVSLQAYFDGFENQDGPWRKRDASKPSCPISNPTRDGKFEGEWCLATGRNFLGNTVVTESSQTIRSVPTGKEIGTVNLSTHESVWTRFAEHNGSNYLLVMESGTKLKVYKITE